MILTLPFTYNAAAIPPHIAIQVGELATNEVTITRILNHTEDVIESEVCDFEDKIPPTTR